MILQAGLQDTEAGGKPRASGDDPHGLGIVNVALE